MVNLISTMIFPWFSEKGGEKLIWPWPCITASRARSTVVTADRADRAPGWPCSWPYTVGRPGWPADRVPGRARLAGPVGRLTVFLAVHGWPTRLDGRPCSWPCTVGRPGWPADRVPGRALVLVVVVVVVVVVVLVVLVVVVAVVVVVVGGWPADRVPGHARLAGPVGRLTVFLAVHGSPTRWGHDHGPVARPAPYSILHYWVTFIRNCITYITLKYSQVIGCSWYPDIADKTSISVTTMVKYTVISIHTVVSQIYFNPWVQPYLLQVLARQRAPNSKLGLSRVGSPTKKWFFWANQAEIDIILLITSME